MSYLNASDIQSMLSRKSVKVDRTGQEIDDYLSQFDGILAQNLEPASDPFQSQHLNQQALGGRCALVYGNIQFSLPYFGWYRVALDDGDGILPCCALETSTSPGLIGPRSTGMYQPNTPVLVCKFEKPTGLYGIIVGAIPDIVSDGNVIFSDFHMQGSGVGVKRDKYLRDYLTALGDEGGAIDFSNHRPIDELSNDWGIMTETGAGVHIDPRWAYLRISEVCGIFLNLHDQHAVFAGYNSDTLSAMHIETRRNDEGEHFYYLGEALYPWEALGSISPDTEAFTENSDEDVHLEKAVGKYEPKTMDQKAFNRYEEYGGYLGQGRIRQMSLPPSAEGYLHTDASEEVINGVFREQITPDGAIAIGSAKSVILAKRSLYPVPKRIKRSEDYSANADSVENRNYKFSGHYEAEDGKEHVVSDFSATGDDGHLVTVAAVLDLHSYTFNWKSLHPFHYHTEDYTLPEESELDLEKVQQTPDFSSLEQNMWLPRPEARTLTVDHRYGEVDYYQVLSHLSLTDDGGVVLAGGAGEEIRMVGGSIQISCPGNLFLQPGRSIVGLGGDDVILRAKNSMDLTTSDGDMRFKAERNQHFLSGNSGVGGTLIENRAQGNTQDYPTEGGEQIKSSGVVVKCPSSIFGTIVREVYARTDGGPIVLDASKGRSEVKVLGSTVETFATSKIRQNFMNASGVVQGVNEFSSQSNVFGDALYVNGNLRVRGSAQIKNGVSVTDGHYLAPSPGDVTRLRNVDQVRSQIDQINETHNTFKEEGNETYANEIEETYYGRDKIGNGDVQTAVSFSLREADEYNTNDFKLPQTYWQVLAEGSGAGNAWKEPVVKYQGSREMMPWPGKKAWTSSDGLLTFPKEQLKLYDLANGRSFPRTKEDYENPTFGEFTPGKPEDKYKVLG